MRASVRKVIVSFTDRFEGTVRTLYTDVRNLVSIAIGNLVDASPQGKPWSPALGLEFVHKKTGAPATQDEIIAAWLAVKNGNVAKAGWTAAVRLPANQIELTDHGVETVVLRKLEANDIALKARFPDFEEWPAEAQLAVHSMAWACGSGFDFPKLARALRARDFDTAVLECHMNEWTPEGIHNVGLVPRNVANKILFANAAIVQAYKLDPDAIHWPSELKPAEPSSPEEFEHTDPSYTDP